MDREQVSTAPESHRLEFPKGKLISKSAGKRKTKFFRLQIANSPSLDVAS